MDELSAMDCCCFFLTKRRDTRIHLPAPMTRVSISVCDMLIGVRERKKSDTVFHTRAKFGR